jgi:hypothetical protein
VIGSRQYRGQASRPLPVWNGILEHLPKMGMALWLFLWCLDKITYEEDGVGHVLGGAPVKMEEIAAELGRSSRALRRDLRTLKSRYLRLRWTPYGYVIHVLNSRKFGIWKPLDSPATNGNARDRNGKAPTKNGRAQTKFGRSKEDAAEKQQPTAALIPNPEDAIWKFLGIDPCGPPSFRTLLESGWLSRNGHRPSVLIGETIDAWETAEGEKLRRAPQLFKALAELRQREKQETQSPKEAAEPIHAFTAAEIPA